MWFSHPLNCTGRNHLFKQRHFTLNPSRSRILASLRSLFTLSSSKHRHGMIERIAAADLSMQPSVTIHISHAGFGVKARVKGGFRHCESIYLHHLASDARYI